MIAERVGNRAQAFTAMMRAQGLPARLVLVRSTGEDGTEDALPSLQLFTHLLVDVGDGRVIDFSNEYAPFGFLDAEFRNRPMRYVDTGEVVNTGVGVIERERQYIEMSLMLDAEGEAVGRITETLTGALAAGWRNGLEKNHEIEQKRIFQGAYLAAAIPGAVLKKLVIKGQKQPEDPLVLQYDVSIPDFGRKRGETFRGTLPFTTKLGKKVGGLPSRETDLVMGLHIEKQAHATIVLPKGLTLDEDATHNAAEKSKRGAFKRYRKGSEGTVVYGYRVHVDVERVVPSEYQTFLEFAREVDELSDISLRFVRKKVTIQHPR
jgi:hypothetical protein